jgi:hypothetical protein
VNFDKLYINQRVERARAGIVLTVDFRRPKAPFGAPHDGFLAACLARVKLYFIYFGWQVGNFRKRG